LVTVLTTQYTERLQYILTELLGNRLGIRYAVTTNIDDFNATTGVKINYTPTQQENSLQIIPIDLLFENYIQKQKLDVTNDETWHTILWPNENGVIPFDVFAASFYLLSRYEEYEDAKRDHHGRFEAKNSIAFNHDFLQFPLVDHWCEVLKKELKAINPNIEFKQHQFNAITTVDIDFAYLYHGLDTKRWMGKLIKSALRFDLNAIQIQIKSTLDAKYDPYNTYQFIRKSIRGKLGYFILMSNKGGYDKNIRINGKAFKTLLQELRNNSDFIGLHPSYASNQNFKMLLEEKGKLSNIITHKIDCSRQHFLKLTLPQTYRNLIDANITEDYTMAYAEQIGFRASTCMPYHFFDLQLNQSTKLVCYPTCFMDTTAIQYLKYSAHQMEEINKKLLNTTKNYNGLYVTLWHNSTFVSPHVKRTFCNLLEKIEFN
jgi:hypothetical protein